jgi:hypothetical protein
MGLGIRKGPVPAGGGLFYCLRSPQYFCGPLFQQPDFMHADWRSPQLVRQVDIDDRLRLFLQAAIQIFSSPLQRIGAEKAGAVERGALAAEIRASAAIPRSSRASSESIRCVMPDVLGTPRADRNSRSALLAPAACD